MKKRFYRPIVLLGIIGMLLAGNAGASAADDEGDRSAAPMGLRIQFDTKESPEEVSKSIQIILLLTALSLAPSAVIMCTSFTRIMIVLGLLRQALGTQQTPPGQILAGLALFLTIFIMMPVWKQINTQAIKPYMDKEITQSEAFEIGVVPLRHFMAKQTGSSELALFADISGNKNIKNIDDVPLETLIPAFMLTELKTAFKMGFLLYLPFLVIDMVIASSLMSMGMMMLPPMLISLPIKIFLFVLADGWTLFIRGVVSSFSM